MAPSKVTVDLPLAVPPQRVWKALKDSQLLVKAVQPIVVGVEEVEGGGSTPTVGSIRIIKFNAELVGFPFVKKFPFVKEKLTLLDEANFTIGSTVIEGGLIGTQFSSQAAVITLKPEGSGTLATWVLEYEAIVENPAIDKVKEGFIGSFKAVEGYLLANSGEYN